MAYRPESDKRWNEKNKEHRNYMTCRSVSRGFIRNKATLEDLAELKELIAAKEAELQSEAV